MDDLLVIGGGIVGAACALWAARGGMAVTVLDRGEPGGGSTSRSFGLVDVLGPHPPAYLRARREAVAETQAWLREAGAEAAVGWRVCGSLNPEAGPEAVHVLRAAGVRAQWWPDGRLRSEEPALRLPGGALHLPDDAALDAPAYLDTVRAAARAAGVCWQRLGADAPTPTAGGWRVGSSLARCVLVAAGVWSEALLRGLPVTPIRGTIIETGALPPLMRRYTPGIRQLPDGRVWIGGSYERAGFELAADPEVVAELRASAERTLPALSEAPTANVRTGLRPMPADGLPLAGPWPGAPGLYVCVTHSGVTMAQWLGRRMAMFVAGGAAPELQAFAPTRRSP